MKKSLLNIAVVSSVFTLSSPAFSDQPSWYVGLGAGQAKVSDWLSKDDAETLLGFAGDQLGVQAFNGTVTSGTDDSDTAFKIFGGYSFNQNFAVELSYINLGEASAHAEANGSFSFDGVNFFNGGLAVETKAESSALVLDAVGSIKANSHFDLFAKIGVYNARTKLKVTITPTDSAGAYPMSDSEDDSNTGVHFGVGADAWFTENLGVRLEWEILKNVKFNGAESNLSVLGLSAIYKF